MQRLWEKLILTVGVTVALNAISTGCAIAVDQSQVKSVKLPPGFKIEIFADNLSGARSMVRAPDGTIFVGTRDGGGKVYAVRDRNNDNKADYVVEILHGLNAPNGVEFKDGSLYVAEISKIRRYDNILKDLQHPPKPIIVNDKYPNEGHHGWKYVRFGPDGWLYVPVGAPCNVCKSEDPRFASMTRIKPDGTQLEVFASGIRNTVGFDWHPVTKELWFTDNGRDYMGDNSPPDELNCAPKKGMNFGFPYCHGKGINDPEFGKGVDCAKYTPAAVELGPHVAALGMRFYTGSMFPAEYKNDIFIAEHGSWNRSSPLGYRVTRVHFEKGKPPKYEIFAEGWLEKSGPWGRPVDILVMPDGALLVSDDYAGAIYRITYSKP
jgi:glucose/arabinose dehydrogenase